jgi:hypothetical protein
MPSIGYKQIRGNKKTEEYENLIDESIFLEKEYEIPKWKFWRRIDWIFWGEMLIILSALFVAESSRGLVVPTLYLYVEDVIKFVVIYLISKTGGTKESLGMIVAGFSVGRLFGSMLFGWWYFHLLYIFST